MNRSCAVLAVLAPLVGLAPSVAHGQPIDLSRGGPVEITASDGMELRQNEQLVIARGSARAVRGDVTVTADRLIARYRRKAAGAAAPPPPAATPTMGADTGSNEIYRLEAEGDVHIYTATDLAVSDKAVYDIDQAVLLLTGGAMKITTPQQVLTARDTMEYWSQKHMAVGRGLATVTTADGRRLAADTLVAFTTPAEPEGAAAKVAAKGPAAPGRDPLLASGKLQRVEGFGDVEVRTAVETIRGQRGVYVPDTGIARIAGNVRITRGQNQLNGEEAIVNMRTGVSTLSRAGNGRVQGLVVPNEANGGAPGTPPAAAPARR